MPFEQLILRLNIELNPVRARITDEAAAWRWSSCAASLGECKGSMLTPHPARPALDADPAVCTCRWRHMLDEAATREDLTSIREYLQQQRA